MKTLNVYLGFPGTCREALNFYKDCLGGEIPHLSTWGGSPMSAEVAENQKDWVMHAEFKSEGIHFMAADTLQPAGASDFAPVTLSINQEDDLAGQAEIFAKLSEGGKVTMPLEDMFWGARFGLFTDKFGIPWMMNCTTTKQ